MTNKVFTSSAAMPAVARLSVTDKMILCNRTTGILVLATVLACSSRVHAATLINTYGPSNITATASSTNHSTNTAASKTIDASGFNTTTGEHATGTQQSWMSAPNTTLSQLEEEWIQWDLGTANVLGAIHVWNFNDSSRYDSGINQLDIYVSAIPSPGDPEGAGAANWMQIGTDVNLSKAPGVATYTGVDLATDTGISLPTTAIRWIRFEVDSNHWDGGGFGNPGSGFSEFGAGLAEIQFFEALPVPEPGSLALLAVAGICGLLALLRRRGQRSMA